MTPLDRYREKRDFSHTPEPAGDPAAGTDAGPRPSFVIQKHAATRLHYDVRLEIGGVLASWAVPKGPSLDPHDKRLAVHVEDHPLEYGSFEGTIPAGEYGGGTVMVWDQGTYDAEVDMEQGLARGELKFTLHGEKLHGSWALVRMKPRPSDHAENWLLIKHRDDHALPSAEYEVTSALPDSASTGRTMDQITAAVGGESPGRRDDPVPFDTPMQLATLAAEAPAGAGWIHEIKYDGYRIRIARDGDSVRVLTRSGADWTPRFEPLAHAALSLPVSSALLDGEVVALGHGGIPDFGRLQQAISGSAADTLTYQVFDLLYLNGHDLRAEPLARRKELLRALLEPHTGPLRYVEHVEAPGPGFRKHACEVGLEGSVSKRADRPYVAGRSHDWIKVKCRQRQEFVVLGWTEPKGTRSGLGALLLGVNGPDGLHYVGRVGSGFSDADLTDLRSQLETLAIDDPPVPEPPELARVTHRWVRPRLVAEVAFQEWTRDGVVRQPSFLGLRDDKPATDVVRETGPDPGAPKAPGAEPERVAGVELTHPDKVLFAPAGGLASGLTKLDLARYYERIAEHILPHVTGRPLTLVRCPHGAAHDCFYQKHPDTRGMPRGLKTVDIDETKATRTYLWLDDLAGLIELVQLGVLEIHAWNSMVADPHRPDRVVFDLDPGPDVPWPKVRETALLVRDALDALGLASFPKTTGGKGLHVVAPIVPEQPYATVLAFCRALVERLAAHDPDHLTARMALSLRPGRIFVDYLRNAQGATAVTAYSTRARPGAPVGIPLSWEELARTPDTAVFDTTFVPLRLESPVWRDPWSDYEAARARIEAAAFAALGVPLQERLGD